MSMKDKRTFLMACVLGASLAMTACTGTKPTAVVSPKSSPAPTQSESPAPTLTSSAATLNWGSDKAKEIASGGMVAVTVAFNNETVITAENAELERVKLVDSISALKIVFNGFKDKLDDEARERYQAELQTLGTGVDRLANLTGAELAGHLTDSRVSGTRLMEKLADIEESVKSRGSTPSDS